MIAAVARGLPARPAGVALHQVGRFAARAVSLGLVAQCLVSGVAAAGSSVSTSISASTRAVTPLEKTLTALALQAMVVWCAYPLGRFISNCALLDEIHTQVKAMSPPVYWQGMDTENWVTNLGRLGECCEQSANLAGAFFNRGINFINLRFTALDLSLTWTLLSSLPLNTPATIALQGARILGLSIDLFLAGKLTEVSMELNSECDQVWDREQANPANPQGVQVTL